MRYTSRLAFIGLASFGLLCSANAFAKSPHSITLEKIGSVAAGTYLASAAEIVAHDPATQRLFVVNAEAAQIDIIDIRNPAEMTIVGTLDVKPFGAVANSVAVKNGLIAVAVEANDKINPGSVVFFNTQLQLVSAVKVGALPDMVIFSPDGQFVLTANEGEPNLDYSIDPEGSVSIIDLSGGAASLTQANVRTATFRSFSKGNLDPSVRIFGPGATIAQDIEPEYITISHDSKTAWVTLQENNALGIIDIRSATVTSIVGLGTKDHSQPGNGIDASDRDNAINIRTWPVKGFYLPDGIAAYSVRGETYLVVANEGDAREYDGFAEEARIGSSSYVLDPGKFPASVATELKKAANLGRLKATNANGDIDGDGDFDQIHTFGARSFSIRSAKGTLVWDSGDQLEQITKAVIPDYFNASNENNRFDDRSDDKGPEPEGITIGKVFGRSYAFVGLERPGGVMVYDITDPRTPEFVTYANNRNFEAPTESADSGDLGPEGLLFIDEENSPNKKPLLVISNEVSGTTTIFEIKKAK